MLSKSPKLKNIESNIAEKLGFEIFLLQISIFWWIKKLLWIEIFSLKFWFNISFGWFQKYFYKFFRDFIELQIISFQSIDNKTKNEFNFENSQTITWNEDIWQWNAKVKNYLNLRLAFCPYQNCGWFLPGILFVRLKWKNNFKFCGNWSLF